MKPNDARVLVSMNYLGIQTSIATYHSVIEDVIEDFKKHGVEFTENVFDQNKSLLPVADAGFTKINAAGKNLNNATLVLMDGDGNTKRLSWDEFCGRCIDYAVANLMLNGDPVRIVLNGQGLLKDREDVRNADIPLPTKRDDALMTAMDCVMLGH